MNGLTLLGLLLMPVCLALAVHTEHARTDNDERVCDSCERATATHIVTDTQGAHLGVWSLCPRCARLAPAHMNVSPR